MLKSVKPIQTLNLAGGVDIADLGGAETDEVFVVSATFDEDDGAGETLVNRLYAGLSPDVNLGTKLAAPASGEPTTAIWHGRAIVQTFADVGG